jgi:hypothetical protein
MPKEQLNRSQIAAFGPFALFASHVGRSGGPMDFPIAAVRPIARPAP